MHNLHVFLFPNSILSIFLDDLKWPRFNRFPLSMWLHFGEFALLFLLCVSRVCMYT